MFMNFLLVVHFSGADLGGGVLRGCSPQTRRFAVCTQAVVILRSTSYIAIELNVMHLKLYEIQSNRCA